MSNDTDHFASLYPKRRELEVNGRRAIVHYGDVLDVDKSGFRAPGEGFPEKPVEVVAIQLGEGQSVETMLSRDWREWSDEKLAARIDAMNNRDDGGADARESRGLRAESGNKGRG